MPQIKKSDVVVVTGASTGIGRATALEFAKKGAIVVLVARQIEKLKDAADECRKTGASDCIIRSVDVTDAVAVRDFANEIVGITGRINVWINNAGVGVIGSFTDVPVEDHKRVIETNLLGYIYGAHAALTVFKQQGRGILINNGSVSSRLVTPSLASYTASKFGIRGLTHSLRQDLSLERQKNIHVCQINPGVIDTPAFDHAANYSGAPLNLKFPMASPTTVARAIVRLAEHPRREAFVGPLARLGSFAYTVSPAVTGFILMWAMRRFYLGKKQESPAKNGNLFGPVKDQSAIST